jgi:hypothetical protein
LVDVIFAALGILVAVGFVAYIVREAARGNPERHAEGAAREFFDRHGHWPDEAAPG